MDATRPYDVTDYSGLVRRHWWLLAAGLLVGLAGGAAVGHTAPRVYESSTSVLVQPTGGQDANVSGGRTKGEINLDTEAQLVRSTAVAVDAAELLRTGESPESLSRHLSVDVPANTAVLRIRYSAEEPAAAKAGSHAFAQAYLKNRLDSARADLNAQLAALDAKLKQFNAQLTAVNKRLVELPVRSPDEANLDGQRSTLLDQIGTLTGRISQLSTTTITPGKIISDAGLPARPSAPDIPLYLGSGAMLGLLLGLGAAVGRERLDRRVRRGADVVRRADIPVLAQLPGNTPPDILPPNGMGGRTFNRLRNEVLASLKPEDQIIVVVGASPGPTATVVAANLATALTRAGNEVVLVGAHVPAIGTPAVPLSRLFDVADAPGLTDVLAGRSTLALALQRAPRTPRLRVVTTGGTASSAGLLQSDGVRAALAALCQQAEYVVVEAPSTAMGADAQSLAGLADAAILAVETGRALHSEVADAADQIRRVSTPLLGAVVLPRLIIRPEETAVVTAVRPAALLAIAPPTVKDPEMVTGEVLTVVVVEDEAQAPTQRRPSPGRPVGFADASTEVIRPLDDATLAELDKARERTPKVDLNLALNLEDDLDDAEAGR